ncbi:MAG: hypothetical protein ACTSSH_00170 [Candidatus Heimdallarchaeota archaeon]
MRTLICGYGEVGKSLQKVLKSYPISIVDKNRTLDQAAGSTDIEIMHIVFPYSDKFIEQVKEYQEKYKPNFTVIHSTVPVGTSRKVNAIHSPVVGIHPHLEESLKTFTKFLGGEQASEVADYFRRAGMKVYLFDKPETTELMKISQTTFYAAMIEYVKMLKRECDKHGLSFSEVYTIPSADYNKGYEKLGFPEYKMPLLIPMMKKQGGHCTLPNLEFWDNEFVELIKNEND